MDAFVSHSSRNAGLASRVHAALTSAGLDVWLDDTDLGLGALLRTELQDRIRQARTLVLLWSAPASRSRWISAEWLTAYHLDRFVIPCTLDDTPLPQCLQGSVFLPLGRGSKVTIDRLVRAVRGAPSARNAVLPPMRSQSGELAQAIQALFDGLQVLGEQLERRDLAGAAETQALLDDVMAAATARWPLDPVVINLRGYHLKNAYLVTHWDAVQAGRGPAVDVLLNASERCFFETLSVDPDDPSGLNGLGSVLMMERELEAAQFFVEAAIRAAKARGMPAYSAAEHDLQQIRYYRGEPGDG